MHPSNQKCLPLTYLNNPKPLRRRLIPSNPISQYQMHQSNQMSLHPMSLTTRWHLNNPMPLLPLISPSNPRPPQRRLIPSNPISQGQMLLSNRMFLLLKFLTNQKHQMLLSNQIRQLPLMYQNNRMYLPR